MVLSGCKVPLDPDSLDQPRGIGFWGTADWAGTPREEDPSKFGLMATTMQACSPPMQDRKYMRSCLPASLFLLDHPPNLNSLVSSCPLHLSDTLELLATL